MTNWKPIVGFLAGLLTGSAGTYIFAKRSFRKRLARELNEVRNESIDNAIDILKSREDIVKSNEVLKKTEDGNIKAEDARPENNSSDGFKERAVDEYHDYAKQYAPTGPTSQLVTPVKHNPSTKPKHTVSATDDHPMSNIPYTIDPDDFGNMDDYDTVYITYYADGVLAYDDSGDTLEKYDLDNTVGTDFKEGFGEYSESVVCIRNNNLKIDYQIEKSHELYYGDD